MKGGESYLFFYINLNEGMHFRLQIFVVLLVFFFLKSCIHGKQKILVRGNFF